MLIEKLPQIDAVLDYIPGLSTVTSLVNIFQKYVIYPYLSQAEIAINPYFRHIASKDLFRSILLLVPGIGNIIVAIIDVRVRLSIPIQPLCSSLEAGAEIEQEEIASSRNTTQVHEEPLSAVGDYESSDASLQLLEAENIGDNASVALLDTQDQNAESIDTDSSGSSSCEHSEVDSEESDSYTGSSVSIWSDDELLIEEEEEFLQNLADRFVLDSVKSDGLHLDIAKEHQKDNFDIVLAAVTENGLAIEFALKRLRCDRRIVRCAVRQNPHALFLTSADLQNDPDMQLSAISAQLIALMNVHEHVPMPPLSERGDDIGGVLRLVRKCASILATSLQASNTLAEMYLSIGSKSGSLSAVRIDGVLYAKVPAALKSDCELAFAACRQNGLALLHAPLDLLENPLLLKEALNQLIFEFLHKDRSLGGLNFSSKENVLLLVQRNGLDIEHVESRFKSDPDIIVAALNQNHAAIEFIDPKLKYNFSKLVYRALAVRQVAQDGLALQMLMEEFWEDRDVVLLALKQNPEAIHYASKSLMKDEEIMSYGY